nr:sulfurtransferase [Gammaproteobacteria bacterium]
GYQLFRGVNVPSKTFGELVEHALHTPRITAPELDAKVRAGERLIILDGRTPAEYNKMNIPGGASCPNAELPLRINQFVSDPTTTIVINCAGRTRSIMGAENLRRFGVPNPILALENGTQGWELAGLTLERGRDPGSLPALSDRDRQNARERARAFTSEQEIPLVDVATAQGWQTEAGAVYCLDVRTAEEYAAGHLEGAVHAPGGQLVQATDQWVAVRGARIVLCDDAMVRAAISAHWLRGMGHDAYVLDAPPTAFDTTAVPLSHTPPLFDNWREISAQQAQARVDSGAQLLDTSSSARYRRAHIEGARWVSRARLPTLDPGCEVIVTGEDSAIAELVAHDLSTLGYNDIYWLDGAEKTWRDAKLNVVASPQVPPDEQCIDFLFFVHDRHEGNLDAARAYLAWETGLLAQLDEQEQASLNPLGAARG